MAIYTMQQYQDLVSAIAQGAKFVKHGDKEMEFRSFAEMDALKRAMEIDLGIKKNTTRKTVGKYNKGIYGKCNR